MSDDQPPRDFPRGEAVMRSPWVELDQEELDELARIEPTEYGPRFVTWELDDGRELRAHWRQTNGGTWLLLLDAYRDEHMMPDRTPPWTGIGYVGSCMSAGKVRRAIRDAMSEHQAAQQTSLF